MELVQQQQSGDWNHLWWNQQRESEASEKLVKLRSYPETPSIEGWIVDIQVEIVEAVY